MNTIKVPVQIEPPGLVVGPDEILVIRLHPSITDEQFDEFRSRLTAWIPDSLRGRILIVAAEEIGKVMP